MKISEDLKIIQGDIDLITSIVQKGKLGVNEEYQLKNLVGQLNKNFAGLKEKF